MLNNIPILYREPARLELETLPGLSLPSIAGDRSSEDAWLRDYFDGSLVVRDYLELSARVKPARPLPESHKAILVGHMVRIFKLYDTYLFLAAASRLEMALMFPRFIFETAVHLQFLMEKGTDDVFESYLRMSLAYEGRFLKDAKKHAREPLDHRAADKLRELVEAISSGGRFQLDERERKWGGKGYETLEEKAKAVGEDDLYQLVFRPASRIVHGTWHDLASHHLALRHNECVPKTAYTRPGVHFLPGVGYHCSRVAFQYVGFMFRSGRGVLSPRLLSLGNWFKQMGRAYDHFFWRAEKTSVH